MKNLTKYFILFTIIWAGMRAIPTAPAKESSHGYPYETCPTNWARRPASCECYKLVGSYTGPQMDWASARSQCNAYIPGADLMDIRDDDERQYLEDIFCPRGYRCHNSWLRVASPTDDQLSARPDSPNFRNRRYFAYRTTRDGVKIVNLDVPEQCFTIFMSKDFKIRIRNRDCSEQHGFVCRLTLSKCPGTILDEEADSRPPPREVRPDHSQSGPTVPPSTSPDSIVVATPTPTVASSTGTPTSPSTVPTRPLEQTLPSPPTVSRVQVEIPAHVLAAIKDPMLTSPLPNAQSEPTPLPKAEVHASPVLAIAAVSSAGPLSSGNGGGTTQQTSTPQVDGADQKELGDLRAGLNFRLDGGRLYIPDGRGGELSIDAKTALESGDLSLVVQKDADGRMSLLKIDTTAPDLAQKIVPKKGTDDNNTSQIVAKQDDSTQNDLLGMSPGKMSEMETLLIDMMNNLSQSPQNGSQPDSVLTV